MSQDKRRNDKKQDLTIALTGPDITQKDKRFDQNTDETLTAMTRNSARQQKTQG
ncbi:hypothetical protein [Alicyclobacillus acidiphilus]|uniref:hypothetical protein n=1 Tax=Alicyclobacillus acidiphilus TaxID=182455 RepID=UPI000A8F45C2|nr:hypothetical protein [Alicyclobacillus acidiphilus]